MPGHHLNVIQNGPPRRSLSVVQNNGSVTRGPPGLDNRLMENLGCMGGCGACPRKNGCGGGAPSELTSMNPAPMKITASMLDSLVAAQPANTAERAGQTPSKPISDLPATAVPDLSTAQPLQVQRTEASMLAWLAEVELRKQKAGNTAGFEITFIPQNDIPPAALKEAPKPKEPPITPELPLKRQDYAQVTAIPMQSLAQIIADLRVPAAPVPEETPAVCLYTMTRVSDYVIRSEAERLAAPPSEAPKTPDPEELSYPIRSSQIPANRVAPATLFPQTTSSGPARTLRTQKVRPIRSKTVPAGNPIKFPDVRPGTRARTLLAKPPPAPAFAPHKNVRVPASGEEKKLPKARPADSKVSLQETARESGGKAPVAKTPEKERKTKKDPNERADPRASKCADAKAPVPGKRKAGPNLLLLLRRAARPVARRRKRSTNL